MKSATRPPSSRPRAKAPGRRDVDIEAMSMQEIIHLQNLLTETLTRKFTRKMALCFTDTVGSTAYIVRFGDEAGSRQKRRHFETLQRAIEPHGGRIVDTAGDGTFCCFSSMNEAAKALCDFYCKLADDNLSYPPEHRLSVRCGLHWGNALTDGQDVTGEAVNLAARVGQGSEGGEVWITKDAYYELSARFKLSCVELPEREFKGISGPVALFRLEWQDKDDFVTSVFIDETRQEIALPPKDTITFGRFAGGPQKLGNDIVLDGVKGSAANAISRYHFDLRRGSRSFLLRVLSGGITEVNGKRLAEGDEVRLLPGAVVRVANTLTLRFRGPRSGDNAGLTRLDTTGDDRAAAFVHIEETDEHIELPQKALITFGRARGGEGGAGNDVALATRDPDTTRSISRHHFELRRSDEGFRLRSVSTSSTIVNGRPLTFGEEAPVLPGTVVVVANVLTLRFGTSSDMQDDSLMTRIC
ncbi:MAG: adenylate/guanylate cyclase domain-containing protein [Byssovorax sp.]